MLGALIYEPGHVAVNDLVCLRSEVGGSYQEQLSEAPAKPCWVTDELRRLGFLVEVEATINRMQTIVARKP